MLNLFCHTAKELLFVQISAKILVEELLWPNWTIDKAVFQDPKIRVICSYSKEIQPKRNAPFFI